MERRDPMPRGRPPSLTPHEALALHRQALVIDTQQPPITSGIVFTPGMRRALAELARQGRTRAEAGPILEGVLARELETSPGARASYLEMWRRSGVTVACGTFSAFVRLATAFESAVRKIANAQAMLAALDDALLLVRPAADI